MKKTLAAAALAAAMLIGTAGTADALAVHHKNHTTTICTVVHIDGRFTWKCWTVKSK